VDPYVIAAVSLGRSALGGQGAVMMHYMRAQGGMSLVDEAREVARAAHDVGVRVGFAVALRDRNWIAYGEDERTLGLIDERDRETVRTRLVPPGLPPREQVALAELALERAKRLAEQGEDVVVVLDSISRLARAYGLARARPGGEGPTPDLLAVEGAKRWFATARDTGAGSVTLLAAARVDSETLLEALVHETLLDSAGAVVRLDPELAARGLHPAIDARRSRTLGEEAFLPESQRKPLESVRGLMRSLDPGEGWEFAAARLRESGSIEEMLEQSRPGPD
jgi:transcription termination factor Rho